jgi:hypothetical protein
MPFSTSLSVQRCSWCDKSYEGGDAISSLNRHVKTECHKPADKRNRHPSPSSEDYQRFAEERKFHTKSSSAIDKSRRRRTTNAKSKAKRRDKDLIKVKNALEKLRYELLNMFNIRNSDPRPRQMSGDPHFAELVVYILPEDLWTQGYTLQSKGSQNKPPPGPTNSCLDAFHYGKLKEVYDNKAQLEKAWKEWKKLGRYEYGEEQRKLLFDDFVPIGRANCIYEEVRKAKEGSVEDWEEFYDLWLQKGLREARKCKTWLHFKEIEELENVNKMEEMTRTTFSWKIRWDKDIVGKRIY